MSKHIIGLLTACLMGAVVIRAGITAQPGLDMLRESLGPGGRASGGVYEMICSVGFPAVFPATGGAYEFTPGSWFESPPGDCALDGLVSLIDYAELSPCLAGPNHAIVDSACRCFDLDRDGRVDLADFATFQETFTAG